MKNETKELKELNETNKTNTISEASQTKEKLSGKQNLFQRLSNLKKLPHFETDDLLDIFLEYTKDKGLQLYSAQEEALLELFAGKNVVLNTPTGSGKSLVAMALHFCSIAQGRRSFYTSPIKALVNEKFFALCRDFGPEQVGMVTGDAKVNPEAPIICCTAEILAIEGLHHGETAKVHDVVMDEFHYYSDQERGVAWQIPLLTLPQTRFLLMSATMGDSEKFLKYMSDLNGKESVLIQSVDRPVPLEFSYSESFVHETVSDLIQRGRTPIYLVSFTQRECAEEAQNFMSIDLCTQEEKKAISAELRGFKFSSPYGKEFQKFLKHGMGLHHSGLLPKYRVLVEKLAQKGLLKIIFGTDTLGVGVNVPLRTVLFTKLCKFDGRKTGLLSVRDFQQISGRAGRKGYDDLGTVVVQAPEHVIENLRNERKAIGDPKKLKKLVKKKPPEKGYVPWSRDTFLKLVNGKAEPLLSRFKVSHAMLLQVLSRSHEEGCQAMRSLIRRSHESSESKKKLFSSAFALFRSLVEREIVKLNPLRVNIDLQEDFSLNHALSIYLLDTIQLLDKESPLFALDALTLTEAILESPELILRKQLDRVRTQKLQELKLMGMEYDQRMEELEKLEHPKPNREFIYNTFNAFADRHPWLAGENIRPKSIAREMYEGFYSFSEYISEYDLQRGEGLLLRYLSDVYKALVQNIPDSAKTEGLLEIEIYFAAIIRQIDSSLLDEWEALKKKEINFENLGSLEGFDSELATATSEGFMSEKKAKQEWDRKAFTVGVRNESFRFLKCLATQDFESALALLQDQEEGKEVEVKEEELRLRLDEYYSSGHSKICTDFKARSTQYIKIEFENNGKCWRVYQTLVDPEDHNDWSLEFKVDVLRSQAEQKPLLQLIKFGPSV